MTREPLDTFREARASLLAELEGLVGRLEGARSIVAEIHARIVAINAALAEPAPAPRPTKRLPSGAVRVAVIAWLDGHPGWHRPAAIDAGVRAVIGCAKESALSGLWVLAGPKHQRIAQRGTGRATEFATLGTPGGDA